MPLGDFIPYIADILAGCGGTVYLQKKSAYGAAKAGLNDLRNLTDRGQSLKFFISLESPQESELPAKVFYDDMYQSIIEGVGEPAQRRINSWRSVKFPSDLQSSV